MTLSPPDIFVLSEFFFLEIEMVPVGRTFCRPILFVIPLVINNPASQSSDFVIHSYYYRPNWTKLGPVTLRKAITTHVKKYRIFLSQ